MNRTCAVLSAALIATTSILSSCSGKVEPRAIRVGYLGIAAQLPLFVANDRGFLKDQGFNVELTEFKTSNELANAAIAGRLDIAAGVATSVMADATTAGGRVGQLFLISPYSDRDGHITDRLIVRNDLANSGVIGLKGRVVASFPGSVKVLVQIGLERLGLPRDSYRLVELSPPDWQPSLISGAIDAAVALEPAASQMLSDGAGAAIVDGFYAKIMPEMPLSGHWFTAAYLESSTDAQRSAFISAMRSALGAVETSPDGVRPLLTKLGVRNDIVSRVNLNPWRLTTASDAEALSSYLGLLRGAQATLFAGNAADLVYIK